MGLNSFFFDTYAVIALLDGQPSYAPYIDKEVVLTIFNLAELHFITLKNFGPAKAREVYHQFQDCAAEPDPEDIFAAMEFRLTNKSRNMSITDCIGYIYAKRHGLLFLTGDKEFQHLENVEFVK